MNQVGDRSITDTSSGATQNPCRGATQRLAIGKQKGNGSTIVPARSLPSLLIGCLGHVAVGYPSLKGQDK